MSKMTDVYTLIIPLHFFCFKSRYSASGSLALPNQLPLMNTLTPLYSMSSDISENGTTPGSTNSYNDPLLHGMVTWVR